MQCQFYFILKIFKNCVESAASFLGRVVIAKKKNQENIEDIFLIKTKNDNLSLHPGKIYNKCYCVMTTAMRKKSTITTAAFKIWTEHSVQHCHICGRIQLPQRGSWNPKIWVQEKKAKADQRPKQRTPSAHKVYLIPLLYK